MDFVGFFHIGKNLITGLYA